MKAFSHADEEKDKSVLLVMVFKFIDAGLPSPKYNGQEHWGRDVESSIQIVLYAVSCRLAVLCV